MVFEANELNNNKIDNVETTKHCVGTVGLNTIFIILFTINHMDRALYHWHSYREQFCQILRTAHVIQTRHVFC